MEASAEIVVMRMSQLPEELPNDLVAGVESGRTSAPACVGGQDISSGRAAECSNLIGVAVAPQSSFVPTKLPSAIRFFDNVTRSL